MSSVSLVGFRSLGGGDNVEMFPRINGKPDAGKPIDSNPLPGVGLKPRLAVQVSGVRLSYGRGKRALETLRGIDLTLPEGQIYGLLGPSGCGKTTLLRCVVGRLKPNHGSIKVFGTTPGESDSYIPGPGVGYMPQELALYAEFTIHETLTYFGRLFQLDQKVLKERTSFLLKFLDLPDKKRLISKLSGGQKRRVSLAAALIHRPPLLILDEPTVGVDPLLRQSIWHYLVTLTHKEHMTIIVTTHYIEEARLANIVGLMRQGRMLAESDPNLLMEQYGLPTLEDVFLKLCQVDNLANNVAIAQQPNQKDGVENSRNQTVNTISCKERDQALNSNLFDSHIHNHFTTSRDSLSSSMTHLVRNNSIDVIHNGNVTDGLKNHFRKANPFSSSYHRCVALLGKSLTRLGRNLPVLIFQFVVPSIQVILFCLCIGGDPFDLPLAVVNQDVHPILSQPFLSQLDNETVIQKPFSDVGAAINSVKQGDTWGVIAIGSNFSTALQYRFLLGVEADNRTIEESSINVFLDMTNQQIGYTLQKSVYDAFTAFSEDILTRMHKSPALAQTPIVIKDPVYGDKKPSFTEFMAPGIILSITYIMAVGLTSLSIVSESKEGLLERSWVAGVRPFEVILSHVLTQFLVMTVQVALLLIFTFLVFQIPSRGPFVWVIVLTLLQGACGMVYGLVISSMCSEENSAIMLALGSFYPNLLLSGIVWPVQAMPHFVRYISYGLPQTIPTESLRCILSRGWGIEQQEVWMGFLVSIVWGIFFLLFAAIAFRIRK